MKERKVESKGEDWERDCRSEKRGRTAPAGVAAAAPPYCTREDERARNGHERERVMLPRPSRRNAGEGEAAALPRTASDVIFAGLGLLRSLLAVKPVAVAPSAISLAILLFVKSIPLLMLPNQAEEEGDSVAPSPHRTAAREEPGCRCLSRRRGESPVKRERSHDVEGGRCEPVARAGTRPTARSYRRRFCHRQASVSTAEAFARFCHRRTLLPSPENSSSKVDSPELLAATGAVAGLCFEAAFGFGLRWKGLCDAFELWKFAF
ncbi:uncharacterized protein DS421_17g585440 [Arachis hypogaea]|nr:uncharacterized protein DS421_17g585440 [Arachis hypogaea]